MSGLFDISQDLLQTYSQHCSLQMNYKLCDCLFIVYVYYL